MKSSLWSAILVKTNASECGQGLRHDEFLHHANAIPLAGVFIALTGQLGVDIEK